MNRVSIPQVRVSSTKLVSTLVGIALFLAIAPQAVAQREPDSACVAELNAFAEIAKDTGRSVSPSVRMRRDSLAARVSRCVNSVDAARRQIALYSIQPTADSLAMAFFGIPEYHDEGRLPVGGGLLGPMAYIYASPYLGTFTRKAQIFEHGNAGALVAMAAVEPAPMPPAYDDVGLQGGMNCIWLTARGPRPNDRFDAWVSNTPVGTTCDAAAPRRGPFDVVEVREVAFLQGADYPPVARFTEDRVGRPVIAFKCLDAFCEFRRNHSQAFLHPPRTRPTNPNPGARHRVRTVKGWHDEQQLALRRPDGTWLASGIYASIVPDTDILNYDSTGFHDVWVPAANLVIHDPLPASHKYYGWGLRQGSNYIAAKFDMASRKWLVGVFDFEFTSPLPGNRVPRATWKVRDRMLHRDAGVPMTARFRWTVGDDGIWFPCGNSCCKSDGELY